MASSNPKAISKHSSILIIGAGTWGCSTALHLARRGYTSITALDAHPLPSPISAGNDINKIVEQGTSLSHYLQFPFPHPQSSHLLILNTITKTPIRILRRQRGWPFHLRNPPASRNTRLAQRPSLHPLLPRHRLHTLCPHARRTRTTNEARDARPTSRFRMARYA
jgi:choline dehydrogenase-like flavoprotein